MLGFFEWCEATWLGTAVRDSVWAFPVLEGIHLLGLSLLGGALLVVDLRMLGVGLTAQRISDLAAAARPWLLRALLIMVLTGVPLFLSEAVKCYWNTSFRVKMTVLPLALAFTFLVKLRIARNETLETSIRSRLAALGSITLWLTVAAAGRWIGFSS
jgi:hypothetical protein